MNVFVDAGRADSALDALAAGGVACVGADDSRLIGFNATSNEAGRVARPRGGMRIPGKRGLRPPARPRILRMTFTRKQPLPARSMFICSCNALRDSEIRELAREGVTSARQAYDRCGCRPVCARCAAGIQEILDEVRLPDRQAH